MFVSAGFKCQMRDCQLEKRGQYMLVGVMQPQIPVHLCKPGNLRVAAPSPLEATNQTWQTKEEKWGFYRAARQSAFLCPSRLNKNELKITTLDGKFSL